ncbi:MAG: family 43 glycosylhydrolase [Bacteroides sp.]|nr:family 43 glycosylhydrolase [Bacteroides sp.]MCM1390639.1 family 43 glycosylhydrolase [Bacteroides sp.]
MIRILLIAVIGILANSISAADFNTITNNTFWKTVDDEYIFSQGGGIFRFPDPVTGEEHYYWYGVKYQEAVDYAPKALGAPQSNITHFVSVTCYQSDDLVNWKFVNDVMTFNSFNGHEFPWWVGRLGVAYVKDAKTYALFVQYNESVGVFTCDTPTGNFTYHQQIDMTAMTGKPKTGDQTVFTDDDEESYLCYSYASGRNRIYLSKIGVTDNGKIGLLDCNQIYKGSGREGDCMFKYKGKYYVCASDLYGWNASNVYYLEAESIYGPYTPTNSMQKMPGAADDYGHVTQTGFFYTLKGTNEETVIYCGDRWAGFAGNGNGFNQWVPITFEDGKPFFNSLSQWSLNPITGEWKVGKENNYIRNFSFDADRKNIPSDNKPAQTYIKGWSFDIIKGNKVVQGGADSPVLNAKNTSTDRETVMGNFCLNISDKVDFTRKIYQSIKSTTRVPLSDGIYKMTAKVNNSSDFNSLYIYATSGEKNYKTDITDNDGTWHTVSIEEIEITDGKAEVGIYADGKAGDVAKFDDLTLIKIRDKESSSIENVITSTESGYNSVEYYSLTGQKSSSPMKGINIVREISNGKISTKKIVVK